MGKTYLMYTPGTFRSRGAQVTVYINNQRYHRKLYKDADTGHLYITADGKKYTEMDFVRGYVSSDETYSATEVIILQETARAGDTDLQMLLIADYFTPDKIMYSVLVDGEVWSMSEDRHGAKRIFRLIRNHIDDFKNDYMEGETWS